MKPMVKFLLISFFALQQAPPIWADSFQKNFEVEAWSSFDESKKEKEIVEQARQFRQHIIDIFLSNDPNKINEPLHPNAYIKISGIDAVVGQEAVANFYSFFFSVYRAISAPVVEDGAWYVSENGKVVVNTFRQLITLQVLATGAIRVLDIDATQVYERSGEKWLLTQEHATSRTPLL